MLFETRADSFGDSIKDLLQPIDDPMVRPSSTFLVLPHLAAYELLVDATRELRPLDKLTPAVGPASSGDILVSLAHHPAAPSRSKARVVSGHSATTTFSALCHRWSLRVAME